MVKQIKFLENGKILDEKIREFLQMFRDNSWNNQWLVLPILLDKVESDASLNAIIQVLKTWRTTGWCALRTPNESSTVEIYVFSKQGELEMKSNELLENQDIQASLLYRCQMIGLKTIKDLADFDVMDLKKAWVFRTPGAQEDRILNEGKRFLEDTGFTMKTSKFLKNISILLISR